MQENINILQQIIKNHFNIFQSTTIEKTLLSLEESLKQNNIVSTKIIAAVLYDFTLNIYQSDPASAIKVLEKSISYDETNVNSLLLLGILLDQFGEHQRASNIMLQVVSSPSSIPRQRVQASNLLVRYGHAQKAHEVSKEAYYQLHDRLAYIEAVLYIAMHVADWDFVDELRSEISNAYARGEFARVNESPRTNLLWCANEEYNINVAANWVKNSFAAVNNFPKPEVEALGGRKIRVGYLSSDFREHPTAKLINGLLKNHDKSKFELTMYCSGWDDGSLMRKTIESHFDTIHSVTNLSDQEASELIRSHKIDILVELNGPTRANRMGVLVYKPAPVLINYLGWPGGIGADLVDYIVADYHTIPDNSLAKYQDHIIRIQDSYQINDFLDRKNMATLSRAEANLPPDVLVLGMFNSINKVSNDVWSAWMQIMHNVPNSVLWLLSPGEVAFKHILEKTIQAGIAQERIIIAPRLDEQSHLKRLGLCDLILDPWPYCGHTSTTDALFAGVPVITMDGSNFSGRVSASLLKAASLDMLVCKDVGEYIEKAINMLQDSEKVLLLKKSIQESVLRSDVFNAKSKTQQLEQAYYTALERASKKLPLLHLNLHKDKSQKPLLSLITVCRNRLHHLKETLPKMCAQSNAEVIVVDDGCEQGTAKWVRENYPQVRVVEVTSTVQFSLPRARNFGANAAQGNFLLFIDADIILEDDLGKWVAQNCKENNYYEVGEPRSLSAWGTVLVHRDDFFDVDCFDEAFIGWGGEDVDLYTSLQNIKVNKCSFPSVFVNAIEHSDEERQFEDAKDIKKAKGQAFKIHFMYVRIKNDLMTLSTQPLSLRYRKELMQKVIDEIKKEDTATIEISFAPQGPYKLNKKILYTMD